MIVLAWGLTLILVSVAIGAGVLMRVSTSSTGAQASGGGSYPSISADGSFVSFISGSNDLVGDDTNFWSDTFVKDTVSGATTRVSTSSTGQQANEPGPAADFYSSIAADGLAVAFESNACNLIPGNPSCFGQGIYIKNRTTGDTILVEAAAPNYANGDSGFVAISADASHVAFYSNASNLIGGDTNNASDVFEYAPKIGALYLISSDSHGVIGNSAAGNVWSAGHNPGLSVSSDGTYVAFDSSASNLVPDDTNNASDIFVKNIITGETKRASTDSAGNQGVGPNGGRSDFPSISADGHYVAFASYAVLTPDDTNNTESVFVKDMWTGQVRLASTDAAGNQTSGYGSMRPSISADGRYVAFESSDPNLVPGDTNRMTDIFVKDMQTGSISRVSVDAAGNQANNNSDMPSISADGRTVAFQTSASNLVPNDTNGSTDVFLASTQAADACTSAKPSLSLSMKKVYWASYADYTAGHLSIDYQVENKGGGTAYMSKVTGSSATNGVTWISGPVSLGNLAPAASHPLTLLYSVPPGVTSFRGSVSGFAKDGCAASYTYP